MRLQKLQELDQFGDENSHVLPLHAALGEQLRQLDVQSASAKMAEGRAGVWAGVWGGSRVRRRVVGRCSKGQC